MLTVLMEASPSPVRGWQTGGLYQMGGTDALSHPFGFFLDPLNIRNYRTMMRRLQKYHRYDNVHEEKRKYLGAWVQSKNVDVDGEGSTERRKGQSVEESLDQLHLPKYHTLRNTRDEKQRYPRPRMYDISIDDGDYDQEKRADQSEEDLKDWMQLRKYRFDNICEENHRYKSAPIRDDGVTHRQTSVGQSIEEPSNRQYLQKYHTLPSIQGEKRKDAGVSVFDLDTKDRRSEFKRKVDLSISDGVNKRNCDVHEKKRRYPGAWVHDTESDMNGTDIESAKSKVQNVQRDLTTQSYSGPWGRGAKLNADRVTDAPESKALPIEGKLEERSFYAKNYDVEFRDWLQYQQRRLMRKLEGGKTDKKLLFGKRKLSNCNCQNDKDEYGNNEDGNNWYDNNENGNNGNDNTEDGNNGNGTIKDSSNEDGNIEDDDDEDNNIRDDNNGNGDTDDDYVENGYNEVGNKEKDANNENGYGEDEDGIDNGKNNINNNKSNQGTKCKANDENDYRNYNNICDNNFDDNGINVSDMRHNDINDNNISDNNINDNDINDNAIENNVINAQTVLTESPMNITLKSEMTVKKRTLHPSKRVPELTSKKKRKHPNKRNLSSKFDAPSKKRMQQMNLESTLVKKRMQKMKLELERRDKESVFKLKAMKRMKHPQLLHAVEPPQTLSSGATGRTLPAWRAVHPKPVRKMKKPRKKQAPKTPVRNSGRRLLATKALKPNFKPPSIDRAAAHVTAKSKLSNKKFRQKAAGIMSLMKVIRQTKDSASSVHKQPKQEQQRLFIHLDLNIISRMLARKWEQQKQSSKMRNLHRKGKKK